jgi:hypothetical protein
MIFKETPYTYTAVQAGASQEFLQDITFTVSAGYDMSDYQSAGGGIENGPARQDNYYFAKGGAEWDPNLLAQG